MPERQWVPRPVPPLSVQPSRPPPTIMPRTGPFSRRFDFAWYGNLDVTAPAYAVFRDTAQPMLAPAAGAGHA